MKVSTEKNNNFGYEKITIVEDKNETEIKVVYKQRIHTNDHHTRL
jgi:hypothetical protein